MSKDLQLLAPDGRTPLREFAGYEGGGAGFGGQLREWAPPLQSADAAILPALNLGNARAEDLVRNNGFASNAIQLHQDHIVGSFFRLSHKPNWKYLGINEADARAFSDDVETFWKDFSDDPNCYIDAERKRTFTMIIREGVASHAFSGDIFNQVIWDEDSTSIFKTKIKIINSNRIGNPNSASNNNSLRSGIELDRNGAAMAYHVRDESYPKYAYGPHHRIQREMKNGRPCMIHIFEPMQEGQTRGANKFFSVMERIKMLDTLQNTQLQSAIVKAMYAATIESELDSEKAFEYILGADDNNSKMAKYLNPLLAYYQAANIKLGGSKVPHLYPGDKFVLQSPPNADNGYADLEKALLRYIAAGTGTSYEQLSRDYSQVSYSSARASANESWRYFQGRRKFIAARQASQIFSCVLEEAIARNVVRLPRNSRYSFQEARNAWSNADWIGAGRMAIDGMKEAAESIMLIEAGLSTYEKECAKMGEDYQEIFSQQVREHQERKDAGLPPPAWIVDAYKNMAAQASQPADDNSNSTKAA